ncbi:hypothetical protein AS594_39310 [Streptomyces agglomeratus]|uniref:Uncharacterized protein n=1 Tax=Streptomyces agglomeratus TaxID=285458 RepID=A0A1E5NZ46_9ACTN|nr:hypothetical protein [Streptomyces agglomeratus]OEJ21583.1 hypothetical protein AS594_39310 [Streptomyces agglomeratus]
MTNLATLNDLIGGQALGDHLSAQVNDLVDREQITRTDAYQRITDAADAGDPAVIAATRQTWVRRDDADPEEAPVRRLYVLERTETGIVVAYLTPDPHTPQHNKLRHEHQALDDHFTGAEAEFGTELLELYQLASWEPFEFLLPTVGGIDNVRPKGVWNA